MKRIFTVSCNHNQRSNNSQSEQTFYYKELIRNQSLKSKSAWSAGKRKWTCIISGYYALLKSRLHYSIVRLCHWMLRSNSQKCQQRDTLTVGFNLASDWLRRWRRCFGPITGRSKYKFSETCIACDTIKKTPFNAVFTSLRLWRLAPSHGHWQGRVWVVRRIWHPYNHLAPAIYWPADATRRKSADLHNWEKLSEKKWASVSPERKMFRVWLSILVNIDPWGSGCFNGNRGRVELWGIHLLLRHHIHDRRFRRYVSSKRKTCHHTVHIPRSDRHLEYSSRGCCMGAGQTCHCGLRRERRNYEVNGINRERNWGLDEKMKSKLVEKRTVDSNSFLCQE